jgi:hypothetical protein
LNPGSLVGGVLFDSLDPERAGEALLELLTDPSNYEDRSKAAGFEPELVRVLQKRLPKDVDSLRHACDCGVAWVLGHRSNTTIDTWEPVVTLPPGMDYPLGVRRGTAETIIGMLTEARYHLRLVAPFIDEGGMRILGPPISAATSRGVRVTILFSKWTSWEQSAVSTLRREIGSSGEWNNVRLLRARELFPWPHLKVLVVDTMTAYVGSANATGAALGGRNVELGVLLRGAKVQGVIGVLDRIESDIVELV